MNATQFRSTRFEVKQIVQGPNSFGIICTERGVHGSKIDPLEVHESAFTDEEMAQVHAVLEMVESKFEVVFDAKSTEHTPAAVHALVNRGENAKREAERLELEAARIEAEAIVKRAQLQEETERAAAECAAAMAEKERLATELAALDAQIAAKRAEAAKTEPTPT